MRISFPSGIDRHLSQGPVRFVTRRALLAIVLATAAVTAGVALAAGAALGIHWAERRAGHQAERMAAHGLPLDRVERAYVTEALGRLDASVAQLAPRIGRLTERLDALRDLQARLKAPRPAPPAADVGRPPMDQGGAGGPALPPRVCGARPGAAADVGLTQRRVGCMAGLLARLEQQATAYDVALSALPGRLPVVGARFGSSFGNRRDPIDGQLHFHSGLDLPAPTGTPILATAGGRVVFAGQKPGYGLVVEIDHGNRLVTRYGHASRLVVRQGQLVLPRQHIANVGSTGRSTGPHLHFEVLERGEPIDPSAYLDLFAGTARG